MDCYVNNCPYDIKQVIYRDLGYGTDPYPLKLVDIKIILSRSELLSRFSEVFLTFIQQCKKDDAFLGAPDIPELKDMNYPSLLEMIEKCPELLTKLMVDYLYFDILEVFFSSNCRNEWQFAINELISIKLIENEFIFSGKGYFLIKEE